VLQIAAYREFASQVRPLVAGVSAGQAECLDVNGGTLWRIPVWAKLPPVAAGR
jgi:hypothetical protein